MSEPVRTIDTSELGPIREEPVEAAKFGRAQQVVERYIDPRSADFAKAVQAAIEFEREERSRAKA